MNRTAKLICASHVLVESFALTQHRLGLEAARTLHTDVMPIISAHWVDQNLHEAAIATLLRAGHERLPLVDCISFESIRRLGVRTAFTFDRHCDGHGLSRIREASALPKAWCS